MSQFPFFHIGKKLINAPREQVFLFFELQPFRRILQIFQKIGPCIRKWKNNTNWICLHKGIFIVGLMQNDMQIRRWQFNFLNALWYFMALRYNRIKLQHMKMDVYSEMGHVLKKIMENRDHQISKDEYDTMLWKLKLINETENKI